MSAQDGVCSRSNNSSGTASLSDRSSTCVTTSAPYTRPSGEYVRGRAHPYDRGKCPAPPTARLGDEQRDPEVESHPEVIELKRELRKAQLQSQIAAVRVPTGMEKRLDSLEQTVSGMADLVVWLATLDENSEENEFGIGDAG